MTRKPEIDMSPPALAARLEEVRALYRLMVYLGQAREPNREPAGTSRD